MKIELLAPAGSYQTMVAAIEAGADAVYMGGMKFGARAYAENGDEATIIDAIRYVHLHGKQLYLTVNTLLKNKELEQELYAYLKPLYEAGLDAVIVQDPGVLLFIKKHFPDMHIHASTQMTITGKMSAALLEEMGCTRIVTARELSLKEIAAIRAHTSLEIESFIHGALCYCYSGQCLMSSLFGGRSGNRGRCAQPCRLPYQVYENGKKINSEKNQFALSPKDMCTIELLPDIIRAGVTSLKIEGRMKRPEYTAGVVRIYRKYLDLYLKNKDYYTAHPDKYRVDSKDLQELFDLYNRDGFHTGYYKDHNGPGMMAVKNEKLSNGQKIRNEELFRTIKAEYLDKQKKILLRGVLKLYLGQPARLLITGRYDGSRNSICDTKAAKVQEAENFICAEVTGQIVDIAKKQPLAKERVLAQMKKTGNTPFEFEQFEVEMDANIFMPMQALNELRRAGLDAFEQKIHEQYTRAVRKEGNIQTVYAEDSTCVRQANKESKVYCASPEDKQISLESDKQLLSPYQISVSVETKEQLEAVICSEYVTHIYASVTIFDKTNILSQVTEWIKMAQKNQKYLYLALPFIHRMERLNYLDKYYHKFLELGLSGYLVRSLESVSYLRSYGLAAYLVADANLYTYNDRAQTFYQSLGITRITAPYELNSKELAGRKNENSEVVVYGYQPLMVSAQCVKKNFKKCSKKSEILTLQDRYKKEFRVKCVCDFCYNIIYNSIPLGIWKEALELKKMKFRTFRLNFTLESSKEVTKLLRDFGGLYLYGESVHFQAEQFTKGHLKRGVE